MRKTTFILMMALLTIVGSASADELVVPDFTIAPGETKIISVELNNTESEYIAFEFYMQLPDGVSIAEDDGGNLLAELNSTRAPRHSFEVRNDGGGVYHFLCYSGSNAEFQGTKGEIFAMTVTADESLEMGDVLEGLLFTQKLSNPAEEKVEFADYPFNITIGVSRLQFDEDASRLPYYEDGQNGNVAMTRTINAGEWSTIVLPFTLTQSQALDTFGDNVQLAEFTGFETEYDEDDEDDVTPNSITLKFSTYTMSRRKPMTGGKLFLIKTEGKIDGFEADNVKLVSSVTDEEKEDSWRTPGKFTGTFVKTKVPADGLFLSGGKFWYSTGKTNIKAFRGWFELGAVLDKETTDFGANINFVIDDEPTSVDGIPAVVTYAKGAVYNLQGQYLGSDMSVKNLPAGIYVVDGKKMVVK